MRARFYQWLVLAGALVLGGGEARAKVYLTRDEALRLAFGPSTTVSEDHRTVPSTSRAAIEQRLNRKITEDSFTFYVGHSAGGIEGYGLVLDEMGKHEPITFLVTITPDGHVKDVMVLEYRESRGGEVRQKSFLKQYVGKTSRDPLELDEDITPMTGATISARAVSDGVKKALLIWEALYKQ
ncbi:MAG: FMN-binding protein [Candidatus Omnitrophica bacterium]|nr:FMN-binding protein [Candidatus Omnitrophota bacterium]